jgi:hypothetical protein
MRRAGRLALLVTAALAGPSARADIFSPGPLSRPHAELEGLASCTKCHQAGEQLSPPHCLACHKELAPSVLAGRGLHGRLPKAERECEKCHHEHQGREFKLVDWGAAGRKGFDHVRAGYVLEGKHAKVDCGRCHDPRLVSDADVRAVLLKGRVSHLGAPRECAACHVDEHRGQLGAEGQDCTRCHGAITWKPARFDHARAAYKLEGKHAKVACLKCHPDQPSPAVEPAGARAPAVRLVAFARYKPLPFQQCADCHKKDPHQGRFGQACQSCHTAADWKEVHGSAKEAVFHEKTRYPLRGAHVQVRCEACHLPAPGRKAVYRELPFGRCTDCHWDAHLGQLGRLPAPSPAPAAAPAGAKTCDRCHTVDAFVPVRFELEDHQQLAYRLEGAHRVVACAGCHPRDPRLEAKVPAAVRARLEALKRPVKASLALLDIPRAPKDCRACHRDPHGGQFQPRLDKEGCAGCHAVETFKRVRFDHERDSRFKLEGKHARAACASCHPPGDAGVVRYRPLPITCAGCHADPHAGQLAVKGATDCARCHDAVTWKEKLRFDHQKDSRFKLEGKHKPLACDKCHDLVQVARGVEARRYKPLPVACEACHADHHQGAFRGFKP